MHVTSYGHVAKLIGMPRHSRHVGQALKFVSPDVQPPIPWYRVVSSSGAISSRGPGTSGADVQRQELEAEGVEVGVGRMGDMRVDLRRFGWFPAPGTVDIGGDGAAGDEAGTGEPEASGSDGEDVSEPGDERL
ncbi:hypothetical protein DAEQUDRAFT_759881 [Daedalea quercina L-15889]|uniref:Methylated-DNA-[protein]-cysteine S-methyltransferase DNA binding domain-containing protein n=1 Tax=Daedalea quercina L-15889 TaxID=1314783 RepID=A0A165LK69_9APHY|nr:hypothetical protein DAEQUDRAFT_759881 [Daedalea quercina L-15889]